MSEKKVEYDKDEKYSQPIDNWKYRSGEMKCRTCMAYVPKSKSIGRCRRHAPTMSGWPVVYDTDWCLDHKLDETKIGRDYGF
jgi:hypothetical protein